MTYEELQEEVKPHLGQLVLIYFDIVLLQGTKEDEWDYYYVMIEQNGREILHSAVGAFFPLKDVLPDKQYNELVRVWNLNMQKPFHAK